MTTPWSGTSAWVNGSAIGASDVNTYINDNMDHLKSPPFAQVFTAIDTPQVSTTATTAVPITAGISASLTTYGAPVQVYFSMPWVGAGGGIPIVNLYIDGTAHTTRVSGLDGVNRPIKHFHVWVTGLATGSHVFVPTWQVAVGTQTATTNISGSPLNFWVREG